MNKPASELIALQAERAELMAKNAAATSWGAAVGARHERIKEIDGLLAANQSGSERAGVDALREALNIFVKCAYPVSEAINPRGYNWSEAWLDQAKPIAEAALHSPKIAAAETSPGDALDACPLCFGTGRHEGRFGHNDPDCTNCNGTGIDRIDVKAEAKSQEPEAVAWQWRLRGGTFPPNEDPWSYVDYHTGLLIKKHPDKYETRGLYTHPTTKPEAPAVSVDAIKRDAERYRLIRDRNSPLEAHANNEHLSAYHIVGGVRELKWGENLDRAIDSALIG